MLEYIPKRKPRLNDKTGEIYMRAEEEFKTTIPGPESTKALTNLPKH